ncbi:MAG: phage portal protein [Pirellulales bacterium]|nr:phage portal protein [Pirellulales bacterium]
MSSSVSSSHHLDPLERRISEACDSLWDALVDPREAYLDDDGQWWNGVAAAAAVGGGRAGLACLTEEQLAAVRLECRRLAATNEFAINGIENRISYLVGPGHAYHAAIRKGAAADMPLLAEVQTVLEQFLEENAWHARQQEIVRRMDRDGEALLRFFASADGRTRVRFVEPEQVYTPPELSHRPSASFGVQTEEDDVETPLGYYIDGEPVDAGEIQHRKANVDANVKRGLPLYYPVRKNLRRVEKLLRNMSAVAEIQSAIALIRKHRSGLRSGVEQFVADGAATSGIDPRTGRARLLAQYGPGTILDAPAGLEYDFPAAGVNASNFVTVLQAELRAIAARLVMPEFMFTSDASNANYSSTLVAEGPAVKMFERLQASLKNDDLRVMWRVIDNAATAGRLPADVRRRVDLQVTLPSLRVRDQLRECQIERMAYEKGILSPQTWSQRLGLDYDTEQKNLAMHGQLRVTSGE